MLSGNELVIHDQMNAVNVKLQELKAVVTTALSQLNSAGSVNDKALVQSLSDDLDSHYVPIAAAAGDAVDIGHASDS